MFVVGAIAIGAYFAVRSLLKYPREELSRRRIQFIQIGNKIAARLNSDPADARLSLEELKTAGVISKEDAQFMFMYQVSYTQPVFGGGGQQTILTMTLPDGVLYSFHLDGLVTKGDNR